MFVADTGRNAPVAKRNLVVDVDRVGAGEIIERAGRRRGDPGGDRCVVHQVIAGFTDIAIADRHIVGAAAEIEALRVARLDPERLVSPRLMAEDLAVDQRTLAEALVVISADLEFLGV